MSKIAFIVASTAHGTMIINRFDYNSDKFGNPSYGVGLSLLENGQFEEDDIKLFNNILSIQRKIKGDGVVAFDAGANIGVYTIEWSKHMRGWGEVISIEAQERVFYALAGNIAINNCSNAQVHNFALSDSNTTIKIPKPDYTIPASFGSLELIKSDRNEYIGQYISYKDDEMVSVNTRSIDSFSLNRLDFMKIDVEGMEIAVLNGAVKTISNLRPVMFIEHIKTDKAALLKFLVSMDYIALEFGMNTLALHKEDPINHFFINN